LAAIGRGVGAALLRPVVSTAVSVVTVSSFS